MDVFLSFSDFDRKTFGLWQKIFWLRSLNCILHIQRNILWKFSRMFFDQLCQFWTFWKNNSDDFSKPHSIGPKGWPWRKKNYSFKKNSFFPSLLNLELNFFELLAKKLAVWPNFRSLWPEEHFEENKVFKKLLFGFSDFERIKFGHWPKFLTAFP